MKVAVVGAGIGGLVLAHGLRRSGIEVTVLERDRDLRRTASHGVRLTTVAMAALREMLDPLWLARLSALAQRVWVESGYGVRDLHGRPLAPDQPPTETDGIVTDRVTLRLLLAGGLSDCLSLGSDVVGFERRPGGRVAALLAGAEPLEVDLLVAADGVGSDIARSLAGHPTSSPTSLVGFSGWTVERELTPAAREVIGSGAMIAVGPGGYGLYGGTHQALDPDVVATFSTEPLHPEPVHIWGAVMLDRFEIEQLAQTQGHALRTGLADELRSQGWSDALVDIVWSARPESLSGFRFHAAPRSATGIAPWAPSAVTAIGDAVHAMPPTGGKGASTAIQDAHVLRTELLAVRDGGRGVVEAVARYEARMREYAADVVSEARRPPSWVAQQTTGRRWLPSSRDVSLAAAAVAWAQRADPRIAPA